MNKVKEKWECVIEKVEKDKFWARVIDLGLLNSLPIMTGEYFEFSKSDVLKSDLKFIKEGIVFYIEFDDKLFSKIIFLKPEYYTKEEIEDSIKKAEKMHKFLTRKI